MADAPMAQVLEKPKRERLRPRFGGISDRWITVSFLSPTLLLLLFVTIFPLIWSLYLSFTQWSVTRDAREAPVWVGTQNYVELLSPGRTGERTWDRFAITGQFVVSSVAIELVLGFGVALLLNRKFAARGVIMTMLLIPMMLSPVVVALFWKFMMQGEGGVLNYYVHEVAGLPNVPWLTDRWVAPWSLVLVDVWMWTPFMMLMSLAGLSAVPKYLYEAAEVDRASAWFRFRHITLPIVMPLLVIAIIFRMMDAYKLFDMVYVLTGGTPGRFTQTAALYVYEVALNNWETGQGSALGYIMLVAVIALANLFIRFLNELKAEQK
jgi:multiple sugar transport system permease protein